MVSARERPAPAPEFASIPDDGTRGAGWTSSENTYEGGLSRLRQPTKGDLLGNDPAGASVIAAASDAVHPGGNDLT
jgi:hypothetical protein